MGGTLSGFHPSFVPVLSLKRETVGVFMAINLLLVPFDLHGMQLALCKVGWDGSLRGKQSMRECL